MEKTAIGTSIKPVFYYQSSDCSGTPYLYSGWTADSSLGLVHEPAISTLGSQGFYPKAPFYWGEMHSDYRSDTLECRVETWPTNNYGTVGVFGLSGFVPPFHIE